MPVRRLVSQCVLICLFVAGCGRSSSPAAPTPPAPIPPALLVSDGRAKWVNCFPAVGVCVFEAALKNTGPGCAAQVGGVTRFTTAAGESAPFSWNMGAMVRPNESVTYWIFNVPITSANFPDTPAFRTDLTWTNVDCN
jgi:hypothetical protein